MEELGGAAVNAEVGNCHLVEEDDASALMAVRELMSYLPINNVDQPPRYAPDPAIDEIDARALELDAIVPARGQQGLRRHHVIERIVDEDSFFELHARWQEHRHRLRADRRPFGRDHCEPAQPQRGRDDVRLDGEGRALPAHHCDAYNESRS